MFKKIAIATLFAVAASGASAATEPGWYAGADIGHTSVDGYSSGGIGIGAFGGYRFKHVAAVEVGYRRLGDYDTGFAGQTASLDQFTVTFVGTYALSGAFNVYGRAGFNGVDTRHSSAGGAHVQTVTSGGTILGAGLGYHFTPKVMGRLELQKGSRDSTTMLAGVLYRF